MIVPRKTIEAMIRVFEAFKKAAEASDCAAQSFKRLANEYGCSREGFWLTNIMGTTYFYIQCRRHKKKRINKKWAKRYGYTVIVKRSTELSPLIKWLDSGNDWGKWWQPLPRPSLLTEWLNSRNDGDKWRWLLAAQGGDKDER